MYMYIWKSFLLTKLHFFNISSDYNYQYQVIGCYFRLSAQLHSSENVNKGCANSNVDLIFTDLLGHRQLSQIVQSTYK
jgi:hypothetical protein